MKVPFTITKDLTGLFKKIAVEQVYNKLRSSPNRRETTITDDIIGEFRDKRSKDLLVIPGYKEDKKGADLEWWILYKGEKEEEMQAIHLKIQAKKQVPPTKKKAAKYEDINHRNQIDLLISGCADEKAIPLYCFYNLYFKVDTPKDIEDKSWKYAHAEDIASTRSRDVDRKINDDYKTLDKFAKPMHDLASYAEFNPVKILQDFIDKNKGITINPLDYRHNQLPAYVLKKIVTNELTTHPFMNKHEWFAEKVSRTVLKNRKRDSNKFKVSMFGIAEILGLLGGIIITALFVLVRKFMRFGEKNLPIIITVSKEPIFYKEKDEGF